MTTLRNPTPTGVRLHAITSLRFFAALFVVLHHAFGPNNIPVLRYGFLGVTFFFVLSGFVLTWSNADGRGAGAFYRNRAARIVPLHYLTLAIAAVLPFAMQDNVGTLVQNLTLTQAWTTAGAHSFNWVSWSISCEALFYALFPLAILLIRRCSLTAVTAIGISAVVAQGAAGLVTWRLLAEHAYTLTYDFPPYRFGEFVVGICLAEVIRRCSRLPRSIAVVGAAGGVVSLLLVLALSISDAQVSRDRVSILTLPAVCVLIYAAVRRERSSQDWWLTHPALRRLGDWSFALYMVHMLVLRSVCGLIDRDGDVGYLPLWAGLGAVILAIVASGVAHELFERPIEKRLRHRGRPDPQPVTAEPM